MLLEHVWCKVDVLRYLLFLRVSTQSKTNEYGRCRCVRKSN